MTVSSAEICLFANRKEKQSTSLHYTCQVRPSQCSGLKEIVISCPDTILFKTSTADSRPSKDNSALEALRYSETKCMQKVGGFKVHFKWLAVADEAEVRDQ